MVLCVSGGIAAYKAVEVCRRLMDAGARVSPVLTEDATRFVGPLTFSALASEPARVSLWDGPDPIPHTRLGQSADVVLVAPATARVIGSYAAGISDDLLTATLLATRAPVVLCPALLQRRGVVIVPPGVGRLAGGDSGPGRLAEPDAILDALVSALAGAGESGDLAGRTVLVTAGGTREPLDPVRFIGNRSSGKQGHALAEVAAARGARVVLITTAAAPLPSGVEVVRVETASDMEAAVLARSDAADVVFMAAAVADFRPKAPADHKIKKRDGVPEVVLEPTPDILAALGARRRPGQVLVGFAAETQDLRSEAAAKLRRKGIDLIVANDVSAPGVGFGHDTNAVVVLDADGGAVEVPLTDKRAVAGAVLDLVIARMRPQSKEHTPRSAGRSPQSP